MSTSVRAGPGLVLRSLVQPRHAFACLRLPGLDIRFAAWLLAALALVGGAAATVQLVLLERAIAAIADPEMQVHVRAMQSGFVRLILCDRLLPPATQVLACLLCWFFAFDACRIPGRRRRTLGALLLVGFAPLLVLRAGELAATILGAGSISSVGEVVLLPRGFTTGPLLFGGENPPGWLEGLNSRLNLFTLWTATLWALALNELEAPGRFAGHLAIAATSLLLAGVTTWVWAPRMLSLVLRGW